jgi:WhiB family redox-sensing transcriptional regulator
MGVVAGMVTAWRSARPAVIREPVAQDHRLTLGLRPAWDWPSHDRCVDVLDLLRCLNFEELVIGPSDAAVRFLGWMAPGACRRADPELFFPIAAGSAGLPQISAAKAICEGCAVRTPCLSYGLATLAGRHLGRNHSGRTPQHAPAGRPAAVRQRRPALRLKPT